MSNVPFETGVHTEPLIKKIKVTVNANVTQVPCIPRVSQCYILCDAESMVKIHVYTQGVNMCANNLLPRMLLDIHVTLTSTNICLVISKPDAQ
jgi:hypothetical protein